MSTTVLQTLIYCLVECPPIGKNKRHGELSRFTISSLFMIIAYSTGRPIIIPSHSTVGARHFSFFHKLEPNYNIDFAIHYERGVVNNILCSRRSLNKISVCIDVCFFFPFFIERRLRSIDDAVGYLQHRRMMFIG